jgi:hypothetical protein
VPFALAGAALGGPQGAVAGLGIGSIGFGVAAIFTAFWAIRRLESRTESHRSAASDRPPPR